MIATRHFLNWDGHFLRKVAEFFTSEYVTDGNLDLSEILIVVPGAKAGRRLTELLVEVSDSDEYIFIPPKIVTIGNICRYVDRRYGDVIGEFERVCIWREILLSFDQAALINLYPVLPSTSDFLSWYSLAQQIDALYIELSAEGLEFNDALAACKTFSEFIDEERWQVLLDIYKDYDKRLDELGVYDLRKCHDWVLSGGGIDLSFNLVLVGCADIREVTKSVLRKLNQPIVSLVYAPNENSLFFDDLGCLIYEKWFSYENNIADELICIVGNPHDQANAVLESLSRCNINLTTENVAIGLCDDDLVAYIKEDCEIHGIQVRSGAGKRVSTTGPLTILNLVQRYVSSQSYIDFAALVRHSDFELYYLRFIARQGDNKDIDTINVLSLLDEFRAERLQLRVSREFIGNNERYSLLSSLLSLTDNLLGGFANGSSSFNSWGQLIADFLVEIYGWRSLNRADPQEGEIVEVCELIYETLSKIEIELKKRNVEMDGVQALRLLINQCSQQSIGCPYDAESIEMLGWLELSLDDADVLAVVGMNEGRVPEVINSHCFLPNKLRKALRLVDNDLRFARDNYILSTLIHSKKNIRFIAGLRDSRGNGLLPSRLLYSKDNSKLCSQILKITSPRERIVSAKQQGGYSEIIKYLPKPDIKGKAIESVHITAIRDYLACPYRFYLKHVLRLNEVDSQAVEFNARQFGIIIHEALKQFAGNEIKHTTDESEIAEYLHKVVDNYYYRHYGPNVYPVTHAQIYHIKERLRSFALWQSGWRKEGWEIKYAELAFAGAAYQGKDLRADIKINARIDRVDYNTKTNQWSILDYKTGDRVVNPVAQHQYRGQWVDLQLPIYRRLFIDNIVFCDARVGFVCIPANQELVGYYPAEWSQNDFDSADEVVSNTLAKISQNEFWPPRLDNFAYDEFSRIIGMICRDLEGEVEELGV